MLLLLLLLLELELKRCSTLGRKVVDLSAASARSWGMCALILTASLGDGESTSSFFWMAQQKVVLCLAFDICWLETVDQLVCSAACATSWTPPCGVLRRREGFM
jgi:hypothetical protein